MKISLLWDLIWYRASCGNYQRQRLLRRMSEINHGPLNLEYIVTFSIVLVTVHICKVKLVYIKIFRLFEESKERKHTHTHAGQPALTTYIKPNTVKVLFRAGTIANY